MTKNEAVICLAGGTAQLPLIRSAHKRGHAVIVVDRDPTAPGMQEADERIVESTYHTEKVIEALHAIENKFLFAGLVSRASGPALKTAAAVAEEFHLPGLSKEIVPLITEKSRLQTFCFRHGITMPKGQRLKTIDAGGGFLTCPLVVKPDFPITGKKDVRVIFADVDLRQAVEAAVNSSYNGFAEVEEYIEGIDVSVLCLVKNGMSDILNVWDELVGVEKDGRIRAVGLSVPSVIENDGVVNAVNGIIGRFARQFKTVNALLIFSFRIDFDGEPYLIEIHGDLGGDLIADVLLPAAMPGFDFFKTAIDAAFNRDISFVRLKMIPACLAYGRSQFDQTPDGAVETINDSFYFQGNSAASNLNQLSCLIKSSNLGLRVMPQHERWIKEREALVKGKQ
ncbi:MAG: hypothetical protein AB1650_06720 [Candidatus Omnitrophota bacterium]